jgi:hypothetical protein
LGDSFFAESLFGESLLAGVAGAEAVADADEPPDAAALDAAGALAAAGVALASPLPDFAAVGFC